MIMDMTSYSDIILILSIFTFISMNSWSIIFTSYISISLHITSFVVGVDACIMVMNKNNALYSNIYLVNDIQCFRNEISLS